MRLPTIVSVFLMFSVIAGCRSKNEKAMRNIARKCCDMANAAVADWKKSPYLLDEAEQGIRNELSSLPEVRDNKTLHSIVDKLKLIAQQLGSATQNINLVMALGATGKDDEEAKQVAQFVKDSVANVKRLTGEVEDWLK